MQSTNAESNGQLRAPTASRPTRWKDELARLRKETGEARSQLAARIDRDRQFKQLAERASGRTIDVAKLLDDSIKDYVSGKFFLTHLGLWFEVAPTLAATVFELRREWIREYDIKTVPEMLLLDMALLGYFHAVRLNKQLGDMEALIDHNLFAFDPPTPAIKERANGMVVDGLVVEERLRALQTNTLPIIERFNSMFIRNLRALRDLKQAPIRVHVEQAGQVNVGRQQVNVHESPGKTNT